MTILSFIENFPTQESCRAHFRKQRENEGIRCKRCGNNCDYWLQSRW